MKTAPSVQLFLQAQQLTHDVCEALRSKEGFMLTDDCEDDVLSYVILPQMHARECAMYKDADWMRTLPDVTDQHITAFVSGMWTVVHNELFDSTYASLKQQLQCVQPNPNVHVPAMTTAPVTTMTAPSSSAHVVAPVAPVVAPVDAAPPVNVNAPVAPVVAPVQPTPAQLVEPVSAPVIASVAVVAPKSPVTSTPAPARMLHKLSVMKFMQCALCRAKQVGRALFNDELDESGTNHGRRLQLSYSCNGHRLILHDKTATGYARTRICQFMTS